MTAADDRIDEFGFIAEILRPLATSRAARGLAADTAVLTPPAGAELVLTKDLMAAGRHYHPDDDPALVARKLLRVNLSDLAAAGAEPLGFLLGIAAAGPLSRSRLARFAEGLREDAVRFACPLIGGDTISRTGAEVFSLTAIGHAPASRALSRAGARPGDGLYLTGCVGDAALGLLARQGGVAGHPLWEERLALPQPRLAFAAAARDLIHAAVDISDGLAADAGHMAEASGCRLVIAVDALPLSQPTRALVAREPRYLKTVLTGGDDYELLIAAPGGAEAALVAIAERTDTPLAAVGHVEEGAGVAFAGLAERGLDLDAAGFTH